MIPKEVNDWLQVIGLFGVIGGLIFVGLQLSLDRQVAIVEGTQATIGNRQQWADLVSNNSDVWVKGLSGQELTESERATFDSMASALQLSYFNNFIRANRGISNQTPEFFIFQFAQEMLGNPGLIEWWHRTRAVNREFFARAGTPPQGTWDTAVSEEVDRLENEASRY